MKVALGQINPIVGDIQYNLNLILKAVKEAEKAKADLILFPEMSLWGYPPQDILDIQSLLIDTEEALSEICQHSSKVAIIVGAPLVSEKKSGKGLTNSAIGFFKKKEVFRYHKQLLPNYDVFHEKRYFEEGSEPVVWKFKDKKFFITVCEDLWMNQTEKGKKLYSKNPLAALKKLKADCILNLSSSPFELEKDKIKQNLFSNLAQKNKITIIDVNLVGANDEILFDGRSTVYNPEGEIAFQAPAFEEGVFTTEVLQKKKSPSKYLFHPIHRWALLEKALTTGIRDYLKKAGFKKVIFGLSGGIDSALMVYLAVTALGPENVCPVMMPSRYSSEGSLKDSLELLKNLKVKPLEVSIRDLHAEFEKTFEHIFGKKELGVANENIQARIRGQILMSMANAENWLALVTCNKSEMGAGYATLYGDMCGALCPIADVYKTQIYEFCEWINREKEIIPQSILTKAPSAELRPNQVDQDSLPPYPLLDEILQMMIEQSLLKDEIINKGFEKEVVEKIWKLLHRSEYKRKQAPPVLKVSSRSFGRGRLYPVAYKL